MALIVYVYVLVYITLIYADLNSFYLDVHQKQYFRVIGGNLNKLV